MTKEEFAYGDNRTDRRWREIADRRARFYDWYQEHKDKELPSLKVIAKAFGTTAPTISSWINKLEDY